MLLMFYKDCTITDLLLWRAIHCCTAVGRGQGTPDYSKVLEDLRHPVSWPM